MEVKTWFLNKEFTSSQRIAISTAEAPTVQRETEKAVLLQWNTEFGVITHWVPKSCIVTDEQIAAENTPEKCAARLAAIQAREDSYTALIAKCRENGIYARKGMKIATMKQKLAAAGIAC
jgi:hypothetical protein